MLPMNKLVEDVAEFIKEREREGEGSPATAEDVQNERNDIVLFANALSEQYGELVSVELVDTLIVSHQDAIDKKKDDTLECIDDGVDLDNEGD